MTDNLFFSGNIWASYKKNWPQKILLLNISPLRKLSRIYGSGIY